MNIIKRLKCAAWFSFETFVDVIMARGFGVYGYPPPSPEPVRSDPHRVVARAGSAHNEGVIDSDPSGVRTKVPCFPTRSATCGDYLNQSSKNERSNAMYRKASIDAPLEPSSQNHLRMVWVQTGQGLGCRWVGSLDIMTSAERG